MTRWSPMRDNRPPRPPTAMPTAPVTPAADIVGAAEPATSSLQHNRTVDTAIAELSIIRGTIRDSKDMVGPRVRELVDYLFLPGYELSPSSRTLTGRCRLRLVVTVSGAEFALNPGAYIAVEFLGRNGMIAITARPPPQNLKASSHSLAIPIYQNLHPGFSQPSTIPPLDVVRTPSPASDLSIISTPSPETKNSESEILISQIFARVHAQHFGGIFASSFIAIADLMDELEKTVEPRHEGSTS